MIGFFVASFIQFLMFTVGGIFKFLLMEEVADNQILPWLLIDAPSYSYLTGMNQLWA